MNLRVSSYVRGGRASFLYGSKIKKCKLRYILKKDETEVPTPLETIEEWYGSFLRIRMEWSLNKFNFFLGKVKYMVGYATPNLCDVWKQRKEIINEREKSNRWKTRISSASSKIWKTSKYSETRTSAKSSSVLKKIKKRKKGNKEETITKSKLLKWTVREEKRHWILFDFSLFIYYFLSLFSYVMHSQYGLRT